ncbi:hypothetical protein [Streptomyces fulvoviolaceus]|uniref:hypothetical protein n=1 Tax=Streptomyces fulvoviolaceus TaxID=285535 RepID=UPI0021BE6D82|nr:hypothetical protein [Streptomyces fulvoviolaceus]MCT9083745.1 hypothetical protein [Streptomyces fulvoviolaceus]
MVLPSTVAEAENGRNLQPFRARDAGWITAQRHGAHVPHTLTPVGTSVLRAAVRKSGGGRTSA